MHSINADTAAPVASVFKLYVLHALGDAVASGKAERGVLVCGTGIGISMAANRNPKVRAALVHDVTSARLSRLHNDANVVAFGQRLIGTETAREALKVFLGTEFEGGRHTHRVAKLSKGCTK